MSETEEERVSLVTGGTDGIGRAVALGLARGGDRVLFVGRDAEKGERVLAALQEVRPGADHAFLPADLSLLSETAGVADEAARLTDRLDAVVFCAGILSTVPEWTGEGLERNFVLNYLTRYLLARRLLPVLEEAPSGRLVLVSNAGMYRDSLDLEDLQYGRGRPGMRVAGRTQFANDLLAVELADRLRDTRVEVTCVFPGVTGTAFLRNARGLPWVARFLGPMVLRLISSPPETAARTPVFLAQDTRAVDTGGRFCGPKLRERVVPARQPSGAARRAVGGQRRTRATLPDPGRSWIGRRNKMNARQMPNPGETGGWEVKSPLLDDINHLTFITADMDRLISFYERVFDARVKVDLEEEGLRHTFIEVGPHTVLHPFQVPGVEPPGQQPMFQRGRLDHFALNAAGEEAFRELRRRLAAEGALDSVVTDMGSMLIFSFLDPDDGRHEVVWRKPGVPVEAGLRRAEWRTVELR